MKAHLTYSIFGTIINFPHTLFTSPFSCSASDYNGNCAACILSNNSYYYCTKNNSCLSSFVDYYSCEMDIRVCLYVASTDLGVKESLLLRSYTLSLTRQYLILLSLQSRTKTRSTPHGLKFNYIIHQILQLH